jgi:hypothetical protein
MAVTELSRIAQFSHSLFQLPRLPRQATIDFSHPSSHALWRSKTPLKPDGHIRVPTSEATFATVDTPEFSCRFQQQTIFDTPYFLSALSPVEMFLTIVRFLTNDFTILMCSLTLFYYICPELPNFRFATHIPPVDVLVATCLACILVVRCTHMAITHRHLSYLCLLEGLSQFVSLAYFE